MAKPADCAVQLRILTSRACLVGLQLFSTVASRQSSGHSSYRSHRSELVLAGCFSKLAFDALLWCRAAWRMRFSCRHTSFQSYTCDCAASATACLCRGCTAAERSRDVLLAISLCRNPDSPALHSPSKDTCMSSHPCCSSFATTANPNMCTQAAAVSRHAVH